MTDLAELQAIEDEALVRVLTWMGMEGDRASETLVAMRRDVDAYRTTVRATAAAEESKRAGLRAYPWVTGAS